MQGGVSAICFALKKEPALVKVMLTEFQCNPTLVPVVSH